MPFIQVKTTAAFDSAKKETLSNELCKITKECLGKGEKWIMTAYEENASMSFQGSTSDIAYVEVKCYGNPSPVGTDKMTTQVCSLIEKELAIPSNRVYVAYFGTDMWGWNGGNF